MSPLISFVLLLFVACQSQGKIFTECELVSELLKQGFPREQMKDWVCLVKSESSLGTDVIGSLNTDDSLDYGLFQINSRYWCSTYDDTEKGCNVRCDDLLTDDISLAAKCAKTIYGVHGFSAWVGWVNHCQGMNLPEINCSS